MSDRYIARSTQIAARVLGGEMMIMSAVDSTFFTLNEVATAVWQAADGRTPLSEIVAILEIEVEPVNLRLQRATDPLDYSDPKRRISAKAVTGTVR